MDLRVQRTKNSIINAFIELRGKKALEKITIKELADLAMINKATFYLHYKDIYELSDILENEIIQTVLKNAIKTDLLEIDLYQVIYQIFDSFISQGELLNIIFSGNRMGIFIDKLECEMKKIIFEQYAGYKDKDEFNIMLSLLIQGAFHAFDSNRERKMEVVLHTIAKITQHIYSMYTGEPEQ